MKKERKLLRVADLQLNEGQLGWLPKNPRQWTQEEVDKTKDSLERDGDFLDDRPLLVVPHDGGFVVYAGNMRCTAAKELGIESLPCVVYEPECVEDRDTIKRRSILDNGSFGAWDWDALANEWDDLPLGDWGVPAWKTDNLPEELDGVDIEPDELPKLEGDDETENERTIICYKAEVAESLAAYLGITDELKVVYKFDGEKLV